MAERYRRTRGVLLQRIGSFFRRLFGLKSKDQYLDSKKMDSIDQTATDEPERLTIQPETTPIPEVAQDKEPVESKEIDEELEREFEIEEDVSPAVSAAESAATTADDGDSFDEDTFYPEY